MESALKSKNTLKRKSGIITGPASKRRRRNIPNAVEKEQSIGMYSIPSTIDIKVRFFSILQ